MGENIKVLITVKTYPLPSVKYKELVCTAGVFEDGTFIRLYPIDYRYRPYWQWYSKYQWIELEVEKNTEDPRPESFRPVDGAKIAPLGEPLSTDNNWAERKKYVLAKGVQTMCCLNKLKQNECSLGIVRLREVKDFKIEQAKRNWKPEWQNLLDQQELFGPKRKPLEKIPYDFSYVFLCDEPKCPGHSKKVEDWEIGKLYLKMWDKYHSEKIAVQKVKEKFLDEICSPNKDTHFFVGTVLRFGSWIILGAFYPSKEDPRLRF